MSFRMRKSIKLGPGVRLNVSHRGAGVRVGGPGGGMSWNTSGRRSASVGVPGSGVGYQTQWTAGSSSRERAPRPAPLPSPAPPKPGMFAPAHEKAFYKAVQAYLAGDATKAASLFMESSEKDVKDKALADDFFAGMIGVQTGDDERAVRLLEKVVQDPRELPDELMAKYVPGGGIAIGVTEHVRVEVPFGSLAAALTLVECYQATGRADEAIGVVQQLADAEPHPFLMLSLCELLAESEAWDEIVDAAAGVKNEDDVTLQVRLYQARAFQEQGMQEAALEAYKDALRSSKRDPELLKAARYERGRLYIAAGKKSQGRKDLERVYADDSKYRDVAEAARGDAQSRRLTAALLGV